MKSPFTLLRRALWPVFGLLLLSGSFPARVFAAPAEPVAFDIPAGPAGQTLKQFAAQAGREIVFSPEAVGGVQTRAVKGSLRPREALDALLADTGLAASEDAKTGALAVRRSAPVKADKNPAPAPKAGSENAEEVTRLETYVVTTGSNIPTAADAAAVPVVVLGQHDIAQTGLNSNLLEILRKRIPAFAGRSNAGNSNATNTNQSTAGGSQIALRNLDTLVLINGRRIATSGINGNGGKSFVDINMIPAAAIERMEVLTDGASAIYGSDAIGGVVNIILKSDYRGGEVGGRYAFTTNTGHYSERSGYFVAGAHAGDANITVTGSWSKTDPLFQADRPFLYSRYNAAGVLDPAHATDPVNANLKPGTNFPGFVAGNYLKPTLNSPSQSNPVGTAATAAGMADLIANGTYVAAGDPSIPLFNVAPYTNILLAQEQRSAVISYSAVMIPKKLTVFGDLMTADTRSSTQNLGGNGNFLGNLRTVTVPAGAPYNPTTGAVAGVVAGTLDTRVKTSNHARGDRLTFGMRGEINPDWNWEVGYTYSENKLDQRLANVVFVPNFLPAINGGFDASGAVMAGGKFSKVTSLATGATVVQPALDPFARAGLDPAALANVYGTELIKVDSRLTSVDAKLVGAFGELPAGRVGLALGGARRRESLSGLPDNNSYRGDLTKSNWAGGVLFDPFGQGRDIDSLFAEVRVPVTGDKLAPPALHALDLTLAERYEKYSDAGKSTVPKIGLRWQPVDEQVTLRYTYSRSFTAPTLSALFSTPNGGFVTNTILATALLDPTVGTKTFFSGNGNNPGLQPSKSHSSSFGVVVSPKAVKGLSVTVNYVDVTQNGLPAGIGGNVIVASVNTLGSASPYFRNAAVGNIPGGPGSSQALLAAPGGLKTYITSPGYAGDLYILDNQANSGTVHVKAMDLSLEYELPATSLGRFTVSTTGTYLQSFLVQRLPTDPVYEYAGYSTNGQTMSGTFPKYSFYSTLEWKQGDWAAQLGSTHVSSMTDILSGQIPDLYLANPATPPATKVAAYTTFDLQGSFTFGKGEASALWKCLKGLKVTVGVNNLTNKMPPFAPKSQPAGSNNNNVDVAQYSPVGRLWFISADVKF
ncbi:TonB-dependent receptor [Opitutus sp. GAS368]|uniref:TonB-dependent receptor n=1 Tax=Opitutus sp. GAS368 TaxID=1882749 RepID=UPI00087A2DE5|nr:TonB-dependent receptor [Opitutus sp. GAS368]SDR90807.1 iron complex outermembrane recepter protein [Opitutus sp. GAS368]